MYKSTKDYLVKVETKKLEELEKQFNDRKISEIEYAYIKGRVLEDLEHWLSMDE